MNIEWASNMAHHEYRFKAKTLSIIQPWASAIAFAENDIENRKCERIIEVRLRFTPAPSSIEMNWMWFGESSEAERVCR